MDRVAQLIKTAGEVRRAIWASLPFSIRLAEFFYRLGAADSADAFGSGLYGVFLQRGVQGMPDVNGRPAEEYKGRRLPPQYGRAFGKKVYSILMSIYGNKQSVVEDIMSTVALRFLEHPEYIDPSKNLREAEGYVIRAIKNDATSDLRKKQKRRETPESQMRTLDEDDSGPYGTYINMAPDLKPRRSLKNKAEIFEMLLQRDDIRRALKAIHPSAEEYVRLYLEGYQDNEILGDPDAGTTTMLTHKTMSKGGKIYPSAWRPVKVKILRLLESAWSELDIAV